MVYKGSGPRSVMAFNYMRQFGANNIENDIQFFDIPVDGPPIGLIRLHTYRDVGDDVVLEKFRLALKSQRTKEGRAYLGQFLSKPCVSTLLDSSYHAQKKLTELNNASWFSRMFTSSERDELYSYLDTLHSEGSTFMRCKDMMERDIPIEQVHVQPVQAYINGVIHDQSLGRAINPDFINDRIREMYAKDWGNSSPNCIPAPQSLSAVRGMME